jgi:predicted amidohydrolase
MRAACLQLRVDLCQKQENTVKALEMAKQAIDQGAEILVFPEMFITGFCYSEAPEEPPYPSLNPFKALAMDHDCLMIGSLMGGKYNLGFCLGPEGTAFQPKIHPFDQEKQHFLGGDSISPVKTKRGKVGLQICYDLRFPEVARSLSLQGSDFLVTIGQFPKRLAHWRVLCLARAIENQLPHLACNWANAGGSLIIDSKGRVQAEAGLDREEAIFGEVDYAMRDQWREEIFYLSERRPAVY